MDKLFTRGNHLRLGSFNKEEKNIFVGKSKVVRYVSVCLLRLFHDEGKFLQLLKNEYNLVRGLAMKKSLKIIE